jgi:hypothetical protein
MCRIVKSGIIVWLRDEEIEFLNVGSENGGKHFGGTHVGNAMLSDVLNEQPEMFLPEPLSNI